MYTVNISFKIPHELFGSWHQWIRDEWQPKIAEMCADASFRLSRVLDHNDAEGVTVVFQLFFASVDLMSRFLEDGASQAHGLILKKWGEKILFFQTILQQIDL